ncbi:response regulator [Brevundimonas sp.]|uniref:response regulator n=1 Tax=Brevundimonas sp. TaxID=1871086 RepID=UPI002FC92D18
MSVQERVLLLALRGRDAEVMAQVLTRDGHDCLACAGVDDLADQIAIGAGVALITEESLAVDRTRLTDWLEAQPAWSDFPFILLATKRAGRRPRDAQIVLEQMGNVVVLERPIHGETLASAVTSALRGRRRQYEARRLLDDLTLAEDRLTQLNASLETRIALRTSELSAANNRLTEEVGERERAQAALVQAQKMEAVGQLTGGIAHDFNNLLTVIFGNLDLIQRRTEEEKTARLAGYARQAADRAARLTHQLLAFSRSQRLNLQPVDLNALVLGMSDLLARTIGPQITIEMAPGGDRPWAMADENQLELAILNLAINARDAMGDGGTLRIATRADAADDATLTAGGYGVVTVSDTGCGIPASLIDKVFDPFFTTKPVGKGTGLGLSQVFGIARQSGGTIRIDSREGEGVRVEIWLPLTAPAAAAPEPAADREAPVRSERERVLVIDDDEGVRQFIVDSLEGSGYAVVATASGADGLKSLRETAPDLIIVDYAMPGMNGVEVVTEARRHLPSLPIILATGYADMAAVDTVMDPGRVLRKPFRVDDLNAAVRAALAEREAA